MILGQDMLHVIRPLEYFETDRKVTLIAVRIPLAWVVTGTLPLTSGIFSTCFKAVTQTESDVKLADQFRSWYDMKSIGAYKQVDPVLPPMLEVTRYWKTQHITTDADISSVCCGLTIDAVYGKKFRAIKVS